LILVRVVPDRNADNADNADTPTRRHADTPTRRHACFYV
jgi:hypothetical protein